MFPFSDPLKAPGRCTYEAGLWGPIFSADPPGDTRKTSGPWVPAPLSCALAGAIVRLPKKASDTKCAFPESVTPGTQGEDGQGRLHEAVFLALCHPNPLFA